MSHNVKELNFLKTGYLSAAAFILIAKSVAAIMKSQQSQKEEDRVRVDLVSNAIGGLVALGCLTRAPFYLFSEIAIGDLINSRELAPWDRIEGIYGIRFEML